MTKNSPQSKKKGEKRAAATLGSTPWGGASLKAPGTRSRHLLMDWEAVPRAPKAKWKGKLKKKEPSGALGTLIEKKRPESGGALRKVGPVLVEGPGQMKTRATISRHL